LKLKPFVHCKAKITAGRRLFGKILEKYSLNCTKTPPSCVYRKWGSMGMMNQSTIFESNGAPLAVCVNDCQVDCGQSPEALSRMCFSARCAFAEMRWGGPASKSLEPEMDAQARTLHIFANEWQC
jgi:hypothetical protein